MLTRDALRSGELADLVRSSDPEIRILTDEERRATLQHTLRAWDGGDVWLFGYGSLIWNPAFHFAERRQGRIYGYHREFCLWTQAGRGSAECPGLLLGLDRGGSCRGVAYRIEADKVREELDIVWRREMIAGSYRPVWATMHNDGQPVQAIAFVIDPTNDRYAKRLPDDQIAETIANAQGVIGRCSDYLLNTVDHLSELGIHDRHLGRLATLVRQRLALERARPQ